MPRRVQAIPGTKGLVLPRGWVLNGGDSVVIPDDEWAGIIQGGETLGRLDDLGYTSAAPDPVPTMRDIQRAVSGGSTGLEAQINAVEADLSSHALATTNVHGISDTALLETKAGAQSKADTAEARAKSYTDVHSIDTTDVHGIADTTLLATRSYVDTATQGWEATYNFVTPANVWTLGHGQGTYAIHVEVFDNNGDPLVGDVEYPDPNTVTVEFYYPTSGYARAWAIT